MTLIDKARTKARELGKILLDQEEDVLKEMGEEAAKAFAKELLFVLRYQVDSDHFRELYEEIMVLYRTPAEERNVEGFLRAKEIRRLIRGREQLLKSWHLPDLAGASGRCAYSYCRSLRIHQFYGGCPHCSSAEFYQ